MNGSWQDEHPIKILETKYLTHDVKQFRVSKPEGYRFIPGEATDIVIDLPGWEGNRHAFTFTGLNEWDFLEFTIKINRERKGFTYQLDQLHVGAPLIIHDSFGAFHYRGEGVFIAGGSGITPFIAILRALQKEGKLHHNRLIFSNKTKEDIILQKEFDQMLGTHFINTLTKERTKGFDHQRINKTYLQSKIQDFSSYFYVCGKRRMMEEIRESLIDLGAEESKVMIEMEFD